MRRCFQIRLAPLHLGLPPADIQVLVEDKQLVAYFDAALAAGAYTRTPFSST